MDESHFQNRLLDLNSRPVDENGDCVIYWMQRSQRAADNLALKFAAQLANDLKKPLLVYFGVFDRYPMASVRAFKFMLEGLREVGEQLADHAAGFLVRREHPAEGIIAAAKEFHACCVVVDEDYLRTGRSWRDDAARGLDVRLVQVDADTVVPARVSHHEEWGAYTFRPKVLKVLERHLVTIPDTWPACPWNDELGGIDLGDPAGLANALQVDQPVMPTPHFTGGVSEAVKRLNDFVSRGLSLYGSERSDIGVEACSNLSPYLHFGQISPLRVALVISQSDAPDDCVDAFMEQLIVRRELAINFCLYNYHYDSLDAAAAWARRTLAQHESDPREEVYSLEELESAGTHDDLWNAAQQELVKFGKIHPYMRMVWAKKVLQWTESAEQALSYTIYLNDKYALDGRDPSGYANIGWCIYGKHDRPFPSRTVFGKVRYMSTAATKRKTHWQDYVERVRRL